MDLEFFRKQAEVSMKLKTDLETTHFKIEQIKKKLNKVKEVPKLKKAPLVLHKET